MGYLASKILFRILRKTGADINFRIKSGPVKGLLWNVGVADSRYILGIYEPQLADLVKKEAENGKRFVDIGSNAGYFSLIASVNARGTRENISVEPFPSNVFIQKKHFEINKVKNVKILPIAVADKKGKVEFSDSGNEAANTYKKESTAYVGGTIYVETDTLDSIASTEKLDQNCFIKIDVEGAELDVLVGGKKYLTEFHPDIMLATHDCHVPGVSEACLKLLNEYGYDCRPVEDEKQVVGQMDYFAFKAQN